MGKRQKKYKLISLITVLLFFFTLLSACNSCSLKDYKITFMTDDEIFKTLYVDKDENFSLPESPKKEGYIFNGWYLDETYQNSFDNNYLIVDDVIVYAKFTLETYTITYVDMLRKEHTNPTTYTIESDTIILEDLSDNTDSYIFQGWYNNEERVTKIEKGSFGDIELTAKWWSRWSPNV